jgi:hypothetical protein
MSILSCFYVIPVFYLTIYANKNNDKFIYFLGISFLILAIIQFLYTLKKFQLFDDSFKIYRPYFFRNTNQIFKKSEIEKINFKISASKIGGGINLVIYQKKKITSFQVILTKQNLKELISNLKEAGIIINIEKNLKIE